METYQVGIISLAIFGLMGLAAFVTWRKRMKSQEQFLPAPEFIEGTTTGSKGFYVATTFADRPLDRVSGHGLAHRGVAFVEVSGEGVSISRIGEESFRIPADDLLGVAKATAVIDRAVEKDGLISIRWRLGSEELETHFRFVSAIERYKVLDQLSEVVGA
jgi:hypothetical protein